jgi:hypothetical protein
MDMPDENSNASKLYSLVNDKTDVNVPDLMATFCLCDFMFRFDTNSSREISGA